MDIYQKKEHMILSRSIQRRKRYIEVASENNDAIRLLLSKEKGVHFGDNKAYMPAEDFVLTKCFDRYVGLAFIDYSNVIERGKTEKDCSPGIAHGLLGKAKADALQRAYDTGLSPPVPPLVCYPFDRTRYGLENHKGIIGA